jgi:aerobic carbon-monoxide dehydrogenase large subunit
MSENFSGRSIARLEDPRLLTGGGRYTSDHVPNNAVHAVFVRSLHAHAEITAIEAAAAVAAPGVLAVLTGADADTAGLGRMTCPRQLPGHTFVDPLRPILAQGRARFVGDAAVCVVAETASQAADSAALVEIAYRPLPSVSEPSAAIAGEQLWPKARDNVCFDWSNGDAKAVNEATARAAHVVEIDVINNRLAITPLEPRCAWARHDRGSDRFLLHAPTQGVFFVRDCLAADVLRIPVDRLEVLTEDVGGAFGMKICPYPEYACILWAAKMTGRPVAWTADRSESFQSDSHGRDHVARAWLALDRNGRFLALKHDVIANLGAYLTAVSPTVPTIGYAKMAPSVYRIPALHVRVRGVFTNTAPVDAYRGAGKPEALFVLERLIDKAARALGMDAAELRRLNLVRPSAMPYKTSAGQTLDSGDFEAVLNKALTLADRDGFEARRKISRASGRLRGLGFAMYIHGTGGDPDETSRVIAEKTGVLAAYTSRQDAGQGHRTVYAQLLADRMGIPIDKVDIRQGDSRAALKGGGTGGSSSLIIGGTAMLSAASRLIEHGRALASTELEVALADVEYSDGSFVIAGTDRRLGLFELAARLAEPLQAVAPFAESNASYPHGCQVAEIEIEPDTGTMHLLRYLSVDDLGLVIHPAMAAAQLAGGIVQGIGQALFEHVRYDPDSGQLLTASLMDYALPRAADLPPIEITLVGAPTSNNSIGAKGAGECGTIGAAPAVINAVVDALQWHGIRHINMPATPERIWRAIRDYGGHDAGSSDVGSR